MSKKKKIQNIFGIVFVVLLGLLLLVGIETKGFGFGENLFDEKCTLLLICLAAIMVIMAVIWYNMLFFSGIYIYIHSLISSVVFGMFMLSMFWAFQNYGVNLEGLTAAETILLTRILFLGPLVFLGIVDWIVSLMDFFFGEDDWDNSRCRFWRIYKRIFLGIGIVTVYGFWGGCFATENFSAFYSYRTYCYYIITMWAASQLFIYYDKIGKILTALLSHKFSPLSSSGGVASFNTWKQLNIIKILDKARTEEQKKKALAKIQNEIKKNRLSALIYGLVYFVNASFLLIACFTLFCDEEDKAVWVKFPGIITKILEAGNKWILSVPEWILSVSKGNIGALPIWIIYLVAVVIAMIAVPSIAILIARVIISVFTTIAGSKTLKGTLPECYEKTYMLAERYHDLDMGSTGKLKLAGFSSAAACIIPFVLYIWMLILEGYFSVEANGNLISNIFRLIIVGVLIVIVLCVAIPLLSYISKDFAALEKISFDESDLKVIENFWAEADPEKKAELERRRAAELAEQRRRQEEQRREERKREEETERVIWNAILSSGDSGATSNEEWNRLNDDLDAIKHMHDTYGADWTKDM